MPVPNPEPETVELAASAGDLDVGLDSLLMVVVADKTGYPAEMLDVGMQLEGDLGIDSIKRVEILSAMQERHSSLPEVDPAAMAGLKTLGQIVEYLGQQSGSSGVSNPQCTAPVGASASVPLSPVTSPQ